MLMRDSEGERGLLILWDRDTGMRSSTPLLWWRSWEVRFTFALVKRPRFKEPWIMRTKSWKRHASSHGLAARRFWIFKIGRCGLTLDHWQP